MITLWTVFPNVSSLKVGLAEESLLSTKAEGGDFATVLAQSEQDPLEANPKTSDQEPEVEITPDLPLPQDMADGEILEPGVAETVSSIGTTAKPEEHLLDPVAPSGRDPVLVVSEPLIMAAKPRAQTDVPSPPVSNFTQPHFSDRTSPPNAPKSKALIESSARIATPAIPVRIPVSEVAQPLGEAVTDVPLVSPEKVSISMAKTPDVLAANSENRSEVVAVEPIVIVPTKELRFDKSVDAPTIAPIDALFTSASESRIPDVLMPRSEKLEAQSVRPQPALPLQQVPVEVPTTAASQVVPPRGPSDAKQNPGRSDLVNHAISEVQDTATAPIVQVFRGSADAFVPARAATPPAPHPLLQSSVPEQIAAAVLQKSESVTELVLSPKELGRIQMIVSSLETGLVLHITGERPETLELVRKHVSELAQELKSAGYENVAFEFSGEQSGQDGPPSEKQRMQERAADTETIMVSVRPTRMIPVAGLDIRV